MKKYVAMIIDLKKSRIYSNQLRNNIQKHILQTINVMNKMFNKSLVKKVDFSAGDEIQGLFTSAAAAFLFFRLFSMLIFPVEIRAGIGVGEWNVVIAEKGTSAQDGQVYHYARHAIDSTEESLGYTVLLYSNNEIDLIINSLFNSTALIINHQSRYQNEVMLLSELLYPVNANKIIEFFDVNAIINLIYNKRLCVEDCYSQSKSSKHSLFDKIIIDNIDCRPIDAGLDNSTFFITEGKIKGLSSQLSKLLGVSRQSLDKTIKTANIFEARNLAITTLKFLNYVSQNK